MRFADVTSRRCCDLNWAIVVDNRFAEVMNGAFVVAFVSSYVGFRHGLIDLVQSMFHLRS